MFIIVCNDGSGGGETQGVSMYDKQTKRQNDTERREATRRKMQKWGAEGGRVRVKGSAHKENGEQI